MSLSLWLQHAFPPHAWLNFWIAASKIYSENVLLAVLPIIYWVADRRFARYFTTLFLGQMWLNVCFKGMVNTRRPPQAGWLADVDTGGNFGFPSGHAQGSAAAFTALGRRIRRRWFTALAVLGMFLVGVSRLYLGVHWPQDVLGGWAIGLALAYGLAALWPALAAGVERIPFGPRLGLALVTPALMLWLWQVTPVIARAGITDQYPALGALAGIWFGTLLEERHVGFDPAGSLLWQAAKCVAGIVLVLAVRYGLKPLLPAGDWFIFLRYVAVGVTVSLLAPWLFTRLPRRRSAGRSAA